MKQEIRIMVVLAMATMVGMLSGCANQRVLDLSEAAVEKIPEDIGRHSAYLGARRAEEKTKQEAIKADKANEDADRKLDEKFVITNIDSDTKALAAASIEQSRTLRSVVKDLSKAFKRDNQYALSTTQTPKGVVAETLDSFGNAVAKVADTPAALASAVGVTAVKISKAAIKEAGDTVQTGDESPVTITKTNTNTKQQSSNTAQDGAATGSAGNTEQAAPVVEEVLEEEVPLEPVVAATP